MHKLIQPVRVIFLGFDLKSVWAHVSLSTHIESLVTIILCSSSKIVSYYLWNVRVMFLSSFSAWQESGQFSQSMEKSAGEIWWCSCQNDLSKSRISLKLLRPQKHSSKYPFSIILSTKDRSSKSWTRGCFLPLGNPSFVSTDLESQNSCLLVWRSEG